MTRSTTPRKTRRTAARRDAGPAPALPPARRAPQRWWLLATTALLPVTAPALAQTTGPTGGQVVAGQASIAQSTGRTTITQGTNRAAIDWQQFNVGSGHTVQFVQPSQGSWTLNRVVGPDPSVIAGRIQANGGVAIVNQSGMVFAGGAQVDVGSLIASAANITNQNFMAGRMVFDGQPRRGARVENHGTITVADRGLAALVGPGVSNSGVIRANLGRVALGAAETFVLDLAGDGLIGIDVTRAVTTAPDGNAALVTNSGVIEAAGGSVLLSAHAASGLVEDLVRNTGRIETPTRAGRTGEIALRADGGGVYLDGTLTATGDASARGGRVALQATGQVTVGAAARIDASGGTSGGQVLVGTTGRGHNQTMAARTTVARGATISADATSNGQGGEIVVNSTDRTEMRGTLSARGGATGGNGGFIEVSGQSDFVLDGIVDLRAPAGTAGEFLLDPRNIFIADATTPLGIAGNSVTETPADLTTVAGSVTGPGAVSATSGGGGGWVRITPDVLEGYAAGNITLEATRQIVIGDAVDRTAAGDLTLRAGLGGTAGTGDITQRSGANVSVNGVLTLETGAGGILLGADLRATGVSLSASGNITQTGGSIAHRVAGTELPLSAAASGGSAAVGLTSATNGAIALLASSAGGNFALTGAAIRVTGALTANTVALTAMTGALALEADLRTTGLTLAAITGISQGAGVTIEHPDGANVGLPIWASVSGTGDIVLDQANGSLQLQDGGTANGLLRVSSSRGIELVTSQTLSVAGATTFTVTGNDAPLVLNGALHTDSVTMTVNGPVTQAADAVLARRAADGSADLASALPVTATVTGNGHALDLSGANGTLQVLGATTADGNIALRGRALTIDGAVTAEANGAARSDATLTATTGDVAMNAAMTARNATVRAAGGVTQSVALDLGGTGGGRLTVRGASGSASSAAASISLTEANAVTQLDARATGALAFTAAGALTVTQARGNGVTLVGGALQVAGGGASGVVGTGTGDVAIIADSLAVAGMLRATAGRTISLRVDALDLAGGTVTAGTGGRVEIGPRSSDYAVQVGTAGNPAGTLELATSDLAAITTGTLQLGRTTIASEATQTITANGLSVVEAISPGAALSLLSANGISVSADVTAPSVRMQTTSGDIALGAVSIQANGPGAAITLLSANAITQAAGGALVSPAGTTVDLVAHAQAGIALAGTGDFRLAGGETPSGVSGERSLYSWYGIDFATTGTITVSAPVESLASSTMVSLSGRAISVEAPITTSVGSQLNLTAAGNGAGSTITQTAAGLLTTGTLTLAADGAIDLAQAANLVGTLGAASFNGAFGLRSATGFTLGMTLAPTDAGAADITLIADAGDILLQAAIGAGAGTVRLDAGNGDIIQNSAGAAITAGRLELNAGGDALLDPTLAADRNAVGVLGTSTVGGILAFNAAGDLALDGSIVQSGPGGIARIESGGTLTLNAGATLGFGAITLTAPGQMTLSGTLGVDQATPVSAVRIGTGAGITQEATGRIAADSLGIRATGDVLLSDGSNDVRLIAAATDGVFALDTAGALATTSLAAVPLPDAAAATVSGVLGSSVTLSASDLTINPATLGGGAGVVASASDGVVTLRADALALNAIVTAGDPLGSPSYNGTIVVAPRTVDRAVVIGGVDAGALSISQAMLQALIARNLVIGRSDATAGMLTVAGAVAPLNGVNTVLLQGGGIVFDDVFTLSTTGGLLTLSAVTGDISQGSGAVVASQLYAEALAGSVWLDGTTALNQVGQLAGSAATGQDFAFRGAGSYVIAAPGITAPDGTVTLVAPSGGITQALAAPITADRLSINASGAVVLDGGGATAGAADINRVATLGPSSGSSVTLRNGNALTVEGVTATAFAGSSVVLEAPDLTLAGTIAASTADGRVILRTGADFNAPATGTSITQTGGIIRARDLSASAGDSINLARDNEVTRLTAGRGVAAASTDSIVMRDGGTLSFTDALGGVEVAARVNAGTGSAVQVVADGLTVAPGLAGTVFYAPGGVVRFMPFTVGATIGLGGSGDAVTYATSLLQRVQADRLMIGNSDAGTITLRQALDLTGASAPLTLELASDGAIVGSGFNLAVRQVSATARGAVTLGSAGSAIGRVVANEAGTAGISSGGPITLTTGGALAIDAALRSTGGAIALTASDFAIGPDGGAIITGTPGTIRLRSTNAAGLALGVTDADAGLSQAEIARLDAGGGTLRFEGAAIDFVGNVAIAGAAASLLDLAASGAVTQSGGTLSAAALRVDGASVQIDRDGNALPRIEATASGSIAIATDGATTVSGTRSSAGNVSITADGVTLSDAAGSIAVQAAGTATLVARAGNITGTAGLAAVQATTLNATASGAVTLTGDNAVGTLAAIAGTGVAFDNTIALTAGATSAGGTAIAGDVTLSAPSLRLNEVLASGTVDLTARAGGIDQAAGVRLAAATLRAGATGAIILDAANPDGTARNRILDIDALTAGSDITLRNALALTLDLPLSVGAGQVLTLEAPSLTLGDDLSAGVGGRIVLRTGSFHGGIASGNDIIQTGGTISTPLLAALAGGQVSLDRAGNAIGTLGGGRSAAGADLGLGLTAGTSGVVRSSGFGGNAGLGITGALDIGAGGSLLLRADDFAIAAAIRVPSGTVTLLPTTADAGIGYVLGGAAGGTNAGRITLDSTELSFFPTGTPAAELILGALGVTGGVEIAGDVSLATGGANPRVNQLTLSGDGSLSQAAGTAIDVAALRAIFPNGSIGLDPGSAGNRIAALAGIVAGGDVAIRGGAGLMRLRDGGDGTAIRVGGMAHSITLRADDLDIQAAVQAPAGVINLLPETAGRTVTLGGEGAGTLALNVAEITRLGGGGATLAAPAALRLRIGGSADGTVTAGHIRIIGDVALRGPGGERAQVLELIAGSPGITGGAVTQTGGTVDVAALTGSSQGDFRVDGANLIDRFGEISAGTQRGGPPIPAPVAADVALRSAGDAVVGGITATRDVTVEAGGALTTGPVILADLPGSIGLVGATITAGEQVRLTAGGALSSGGIVGRDIVLDGATVRLTGNVQGNGTAARSVQIVSDGAVTQDAGALLYTGLLTLQAGSIALPDDNQIVELAGLVATGPVLSLNTVLSLLVNGPVSAVGSLSFSTDQGLTVANTGSITVTGGPGSATLQAGGDIDYAGALTTTGAARLTAGGALSFTGTADVGGGLTLGAGAGMTLGGTIAAGGGILANAIGALSSTAGLSTAGGLSLMAGDTMDLGGTWSSGAAASFTAVGLLSYGATGSAVGDVTLTTPDAIAATAASSIEGGGTVRLGAGTTLSALGTVQGGTLVALSAASGAMTLGGIIGADGALTATAGGAITTTAALTATAGDATLAAGTTLDLANSLVAGGTVRLGAGGAMTLTGTLDGARLAATAGGVLTTGAAIRMAGDVALNAGAALDASGLIAAGGALTLGAGAGMTLAGSWSAGAAASFTAGGTVTYGATGSGGGDVTVTTPGAIIAAAGSNLQAAGAVRLEAGTTLSGRGTVRGGALVDMRADGGAMTLEGAVQAGTGLTLRSAGDLATAATATAGGAADIAAGGNLSQTGQVTAATAVLSATGALAQSGRIVTSGEMRLSGGGSVSNSGTLSAGGPVTLAAGGALIQSGQVSATGAMQVTGGGDVTNAGTLNASGPVTLAAGGALIQSGQVSATGAMQVTGGGDVTNAGTLNAGGPVTLAAGGALIQSGQVSATGAMQVTGGGDVTNAGTLNAGGPVTLAAGGALTQSGQVTAAGAMQVTGGGNVTNAGTLSASGPVTLAAGGALTQSGQVTAAGEMRLSGDGDVTNTGTLNAAGPVTLAAGGSLAQSGRVNAAGQMLFSAGANISSTGTLAAGGPVTLVADGSLTQSGLVQSAQGVSLSARGSLGLSGQMTAGGDATLSAGGFATLADGKITATGAVRLQAGQGANLQSFSIDPTIIVLETGGRMSVVSSTLTASDSIRIAGGTVVLQDNTITTGTLDVDASGTMTLNGGRYVIGRAVDFTAPGGIASPSTIVVAPRDGVLPAVLYDTRGPGATPDPLMVVQPDIPGLPANQQATQVRLPGTEAPGAFGAASAAAAGPMEINIDAGRSAVFLLLDGGTVIGTIVSAGRLGIHGTGGSADLTGQLFDGSGALIGGPTAARFADSTRPAGTSALTRYRINGCVVSSVNCIVPSQALTIPQAPPQQIDIRLRGGAITDPDVQLPNVADEDY
ncbi:two-partner secretion domain-containing protein [Neoroseomonas lacus]|uniref:Filamentous haemagglutinin FhaB/tRNA nuclease CdiA-like TPS domain-containing protein n=1 Tax=Neoroseomonas lacus TaxID=287609 RepID=A0A917KJR4_9PROT|nr:filamentous hemagglutinin N-terminal domain-containing protein [Neoroseomonas lacus]GGJ15348.1 hypothetical protein GCM10011320_23330 [Neoroseomonas lacus]